MADINMMMLGGKRCGKTTVLASMIGEINKVLSGTNITVTADEQTKRKLDEARMVIENKLKDFEEPLTRVEVDENPTSAVDSYSFALRVNNGAPQKFTIYDIPGEWLSETAAHEKDVQALVQNCQVFVVAIDTPYLFSKMADKGYGIYHEAYNKPIEIANFFRACLAADTGADRMVLFVPLKCERYYHLTNTPQLNIYKRNYMQELVEAVGYGYRDLLMYLRSTSQLVNNCTIAVTPILTAGGIDFVRFRTDERTGKIISLYQKPEFVSDTSYSPKFCEQPMIYTIIHVLMQKLREPGADPSIIKQAIDTLRKKLKRNSGNQAEDGFFFIQNPRNL